MAKESVRERLIKYVEKEALKPPDIASKTGIPTDRIRKWLDRKGNPKTEDTKTLEAYLSGVELPENVPRETFHGNDYRDDLIKSLKAQVSFLEDQVRTLGSIKEQVSVNSHSLEVIEAFVVATMLQLVEHRAFSEKKKEGDILSSASKAVGDRYRSNRKGGIEPPDKIHKP